MKQLFILTETSDGTFYCKTISGTYGFTNEYTKRDIVDMVENEGFTLIDLTDKVNDLINKYTEVQ